MSLVNRGFIPSNVDLSAAFSRGAPPITQAPVRLHQFQEQFTSSQPYVAPFLSDVANVKVSEKNEEEKKKFFSFFSFFCFLKSKGKQCVTHSISFAFNLFSFFVVFLFFSCFLNFRKENSVYTHSISFAFSLYSPNYEKFHIL